MRGLGTRHAGSELPRPSLEAPEGFTHSAVAEGKKRPQACTHVHELSAK